MQRNRAKARLLISSVRQILRERLPDKFAIICGHGFVDVRHCHGIQDHSAIDS